jgi:hypothetical protein
VALGLSRRLTLSLVTSQAARARLRAGPMTACGSGRIDAREPQRVDAKACGS